MASTDPGGTSIGAREPSEQEKLLQRHRKEAKELRAKVQSLKKGIPKGDKKRKKEVGAEIVSLELELETRHKAELDRLPSETLPASDKLTGTGNGEVGGATKLSTGMERIELKDGVEEEEGTGKKSKAQKRKAKKAQLERERAQRIAESEAAEAAITNPRQQERERLSSILTPLGLAIRDITPDGHCLYAAVSDQLSVKMGIKVSISELRAQCSDYIREHGADFLPYLTHSETGNQFTQEQFEEYCCEIAQTATWGGQLEILAFSHIFKVPIKVYQANAPLMCIGEEHREETTPLDLSYHLHEYGLGEHYNSVIPIASCDAQ